MRQQSVLCRESLVLFFSFFFPLLIRKTAHLNQSGYNRTFRASLFYLFVCSGPRWIPSALEGQKTAVCEIAKISILLNNSLA